MGRRFHALPVRVAARMAGDLGGAIEERDGRLAGDEREGPSDQRVRDGVIVAVEADVNDGADEIASEGMFGQGQEAGLLRRPRLADQPVRGARHGAGVGGLGDPGGELGVEIVERGEAARGEEGVTQVLDHSLDLALFVAPIRSAGLRRKVIVPGQLEHAGMKADVVADALEDDALEIVVQQGARPPPRAR